MNKGGKNQERQPTGVLCSLLRSSLPSEETSVPLVSDLQIVGVRPGATNSLDAHRRLVTELAGGRLPPRPDERSIGKFASTAAHPKVPSTATDADAVTILITSYRGAIAAGWRDQRHEKPVGQQFCRLCFGDHHIRSCKREMELLRLSASTDAFDQADLVAEQLKRSHGNQPTRARATTAKTRAHLVSVVNVLRNQEIAPASWCLYSCDEWKRLKITDGPPTMAWVYSHKRLQSPTWFDEHDYSGRTVHYPMAWNQLAARYQDMWRQLDRETVPTRLRVLEVIDNFFPGNLYGTMLQAARTATVQLQRDIDRAAARGEVFSA